MGRIGARGVERRDRLALALGGEVAHGLFGQRLKRLFHGRIGRHFGSWLAGFQSWRGRRRGLSGGRGRRTNDGRLRSHVGIDQNRGPADVRRGLQNPACRGRVEVCGFLRREVAGRLNGRRRCRRDDFLGSGRLQREGESRHRYSQHRDAQPLHSHEVRPSRSGSPPIRPIFLPKRELKMTQTIETLLCVLNASS